jgi:GH15 family glucan-1,4-alpha-glucosidase
MVRDIPIGNGNLLVAFDRQYQLRELYFREGHTGGHPFRLGFWVNGKFSWLGEGWNIRMDYLDETMVTDVDLANEELGIRVLANDAVDYRDDIYLREMTVENLTDHEQEVRIFFHHDFHVMGTGAGDTAIFLPESRALFHFKERRCFLAGALAGPRPGFRQFSIGAKGTWRDAEDGVLNIAPAAQGAVDSVGAVRVVLGPRARDRVFYWICAAEDREGTARLNAEVLKDGPETIFKRTADYWKLWVTKEPLNFDLLPDAVSRLYQRSLLILGTQIDNRGGILAAGDSDSPSFGRDPRSYVRLRDGAVAAHALDSAGYGGIAQRFYEFCARVMQPGGYFLHRYTAAGAEGSSGHPWYDPAHDEAQLPIQEDETALVIWTLWRHFQLYRDIEFIRPLYTGLVRTAGDFLLSYRDARTGLPLPSYDLWEERRGVLTGTASTVWGGLAAAADFAAAFGDTDRAAACRKAADGIRDGMVRHLYLHDEKRFARMINFNRDGSIERDTGLDAGLFALSAYGPFAADDHRVASTLEQVSERLWSPIGVGGMARYAGDDYCRVTPFVPGNPWIVATLWRAQYRIARAAVRRDLDAVLDVLHWVAGRALPSGVLAEQVDPLTGAPVSVAPLTWSHAVFVVTVQEYLDRLVGLEQCRLCGQLQLSKFRTEAGREPVLTRL